MPKLKYSPIYNIIKDCKKVHCFGTHVSKEEYFAFILTTDDIYHSISMKTEDIMEKKSKYSNKLNELTTDEFEQQAKVFVMKALYKRPEVRKYFEEDENSSF